MQWLEVCIITSHEFADVVALYLSEFGSNGVIIVDKNDIIDVLDSKNNWDYADDSLTSFNDIRVFVKGFFDCEINLTDLGNDIVKLKQNAEMANVFCGAMEFSVNKIDSADWENEWRKYYAPIEIDKVVIVPQWIDYKGDKLVVRLDPGMAFGTGNHETTALCVKLMQDFDLQDKVIADVGCGSGILGISALKLGAKNGVFVDIDAQAVKASNFNLSLNNLLDKAIVKQGNLLDSVNVKLDFAVANITADILILLCNDIYTALKCGGGLVISGIINARAQEVMAVYDKKFKQLKHEIDGEWQALSYIREGK